MPYWKCGKCHHEFEAVTLVDKKDGEGYVCCDWCDGYAYILEEETPLEKMLSHGIEKLLKEVETEMKKTKNDI